MHTHRLYAVLIIASSDLYSCDLFLFTQTVTARTLELLPRWCESAYHIISIVVVLCGRQDPWGFRVWRSGIERRVGAIAGHSGAARWFW